METNQCSKCPSISVCDRINYADNNRTGYCLAMLSNAHSEILDIQLAVYESMVN